MITSFQINRSINANIQQEMPFGLGNTLFMIAGVIGIATKNGYSFGFAGWPNQEYFVNPLPVLDDTKFILYQVPRNYKNYDVGFYGFNIPDNSIVQGYLGSEKYFDHCKDLIKFYFTLSPLAEPYKDCIVIHSRYYTQPELAKLGKDYYLRALKHFPDRKIIVITNNIEKAKEDVEIADEYFNNSPIIDFYLLTESDYLIMGNSSFSWWGAWLSQAKIVAPINWYAGSFKDCPTKDLYCADWILE